MNKHRLLIALAAAVALTGIGAGTALASTPDVGHSHSVNADDPARDILKSLPLVGSL